jgi:hypothetical protein
MPMAATGRKSTAVELETQVEIPTSINTKTMRRERKAPSAPAVFRKSPVQIVEAVSFYPTSEISKPLAL